MLQRIRDSLQAQRWLAYTVLGALALVFAAWGAYGIVDLNIGFGNYAAKVEGEKISVETARDAWLRQQSQWQEQMGGELPEVLERQMQEQVLEALVRSTLLTARVEDLGYRVSDDDLREAIRQQPAFQLDGKYSPEVAQSALARAGLSPREFERELRQSLQREQLQNGVQISGFLTPREIGRLRALQDEQREVRYAVLTPEKFAGEEPVSDEDIAKYYETNQSRFMTPEWVRLAWAEVRLEQVAAQMQVSDEEIKAAYERDRSAYVQPERRYARHVLIKVEEGKDDAAAKKEAEALLARARAGADFAALAREHSEDLGSARNGGDLGWIERESTVASELVDALFSMKPGEVEGPVKTRYGYHILRLEAVEEGRTRTLEDVRDEIAAQLRRALAEERFGDIQEELDRALGEPGANLEALAERFGMTTGEVARFERGSGGAPLGDAPELQEIVFSTTVLDEKRLGGPVALGEDRLVVVQALEHHPPKPKPLEEVREAIVATLTRERGAAAAAEAAEKAREKLASGTPFDEVAKELGFEAEPARFVGRQDPSVPGEVRNLVFAAPKPAEGKPVVRAARLPNDSSAVVLVTDVRSEPQSASSDEQAQWARQVIARQGVRELTAYIEEARRTADVDKNPRAFE